MDGSGSLHPFGISITPSFINALTIGVRTILARRREMSRDFPADSKIVYTSPKQHVPSPLTKVPVLCNMKLASHEVDFIFREGRP